jgi:hypothetical protein
VDTTRGYKLRPTNHWFSKTKRGVNPFFYYQTYLIPNA